MCDDDPDRNGTEGKAAARARIDEMALSMVCHLVSGEATAADLREAEAWRDQNADHAAAFGRATHTWTLVGVAGERLLRRSPVDRLPVRLFPRGTALPRRAMLAGGLAASAAALAVAVRPEIGLEPLSSLAADYRTGKGVQRLVTTRGGVSVRLNTETSLDLPASGDGIERIALISGEAAIGVAAARGRHVVLTAGQGSVTTDDADFLVRRDLGTRCVTCVRGSLLVERGASRLALSAGQMVGYEAEGLGAVTRVDAEAASAWQQGMLVFHGAALSQVVAELNRYRRGRIVVLNAYLAQRPVSARVRLDHIDDVLALLGAEYAAHVTRLPGGLAFIT